MTSSEWTRHKKNKLIELYRQMPLLWAKKGQKVHPRQRSNALQQIADEISVNVLEVEKKLHVLRSQFMRERKRILKSILSGDEDIYESHWQYYKRLEFLADPLEPLQTINIGTKINPNISEGENSNQSVSTHKTGDGIDELCMENQNTQLYHQPTHTKSFTNASTVLHGDTSSHSFTREEGHFPNPDDDSLNEREVAHNETSNGVDFATGSTEDTLVPFGNYLVSLLRRLPLDKSYQLQKKFISETMHTRIQHEKERTLLLQKKIIKNEDSPAHKKARQENSRVDGLSNTGVPSRNLASECPTVSSEKSGQAVRLNNVHASGGNNALDGINNGVAPEISVEVDGPQISGIKMELETNFEMATEGVSGGLKAPSENNKVICFQCSWCKELFQTSIEYKRHIAVKHPGLKNGSSGRAEGASKRPCLD